MKKVLFLFLLMLSCGLLILSQVDFVLASNPAGNPTGQPIPDKSSEGSGNTLQNPLGEIKDPQTIIANIIRALLGVVGSLALLVFMYGGFTWVISQGNEEKIKKGKDMVIWASLGLAMIFFSYAVVTFIVNALIGAGTGNNPVEGTRTTPVEGARRQPSHEKVVVLK